MPTLYLVRHTRPNTAPGICYGRLDLDVSADFETDAAAVAALLPPLNLIVTSPLQRAAKLAEFIAKKQGTNTIKTDQRLIEKHFGSWEGLAWDNIARNEIDAWAADIDGYSPPGGESVKNMMLRINSMLSELKKLKAQHIALVCHSGSIRCVLALLADINLADTLSWDIDYGAVIAARLKY